jgi:hypothetical protein
MATIQPPLYGTDFNHFQELSINTVDYPDDNNPQTVIRFRGPQRIILICTSGSVYYSFVGQQGRDHGKMTAGEPSEKLEFETRAGKKIYWRGTGDVEVHAWHIGV